MLDAGRSRFRHYTRRSVIGIGALVLAGGLIGCTEKEEVQYVYPSTTNPPEPGIWTTGLTDDLYTRLGEISVKTNFGRMGEVGAKPVLLDTVTYQVISNCGDVTRQIASWDGLISDTQQHTSLNDEDVVTFYNFVRDEICPNVDPNKLN